MVSALPALPILVSAASEAGEAGGDVASEPRTAGRWAQLQGIGPILEGTDGRSAARAFVSASTTQL